MRYRLPLYNFALCLFLVIISLGVLAGTTSAAPVQTFDGFSALTPSGNVYEHPNASLRRVYFQGGTAGSVNIGVDTTSDTNTYPVLGIQYEYRMRSIDWRQGGLATGWSLDVAKIATDYPANGVNGDYQYILTGQHGNTMATTVRYNFTAGAVSTTGVNVHSYQERRSQNCLVVCLGWSSWSLFDNSTDMGFDFVRDETPPSVGSAEIDLVNNSWHSPDATIPMSGVMTEAQSGTASGYRDMRVDRRTRTLSGNTCTGAWGSYTTIEASVSTLNNINETGLASACYQYRIVGFDNVGNSQILESNPIRVFDDSSLDPFEFDSLSDGTNNVTSYNFPTNSLPVVGGGSRVRSPDFIVNKSGNSVGPHSSWRAKIEVETQLNGPGGNVPNNALAVEGDAQTSGYVDLSTTRIFETGIAHNVDATDIFTLRFIPPAGLQSGDYSGTLRITIERLDEADDVSGSDVFDLPVTVHLLAYLSIVDVRNLTADVVSGGTPNMPVTSFDFPSQGPGTGKVRSDSLDVRVNANTLWDLKANMPYAPQRAGDPSTTKAINTFGLCLGSCGTISNFTSAGEDVLIQSGVAAGANVNSVPFSFVSHSTGLVPAGDYEGEFVITVTASD